MDYRRILIYLSVDLSVDKFHYTMEELDDDISFEHLLSFTMFSDCDIAAGEFCAPPIFDLPPPPRPPWLGDVIPCSDSTCPNDPVVHSITRNSDEQWSGMFHNVITVVVASISIVISLLVLVAFIIRHRRQSRNLGGYLIQKEGSGSSSLQHHQCTVGTLLQQYNNHTTHKHLNHYIKKTPGTPTNGGGNGVLVTGIRSLKSPGMNSAPGTSNKPGQMLETLIIGGVPFHVVHKECANAAAANGGNSSSQPPIYETIDDPCQSETNVISRQNFLQSAVLNQMTSPRSVVLPRNIPPVMNYNSEGGVIDGDRIYAELENPAGEEYSETVSYQCTCEHNSSRTSGSGGTSSDTTSSPCSSPRLAGVEEDSGFRSSVTNSSLYSSQRYSHPPEIIPGHILTGGSRPHFPPVTATITSRPNFRTSSTRSTAASRRRVQPPQSPSSVVPSRFAHTHNTSVDVYTNPYQPDSNNGDLSVPKIELAFKSASPRRKSKRFDNVNLPINGAQLMEVYLEPANYLSK